MAVMTIPASPGASLAEYDGGKFAGEIDRRKRCDPPDLQGYIILHGSMHKAFPE